MTADTNKPATGSRFQDVVELMNRLLAPAPDGCPWDREQTLDSLRPYLLEEAHEVWTILDSLSSRRKELLEEEDEGQKAQQQVDDVVDRLRLTPA